MKTRAVASVATFLLLFLVLLGLIGLNGYWFIAYEQTTSWTRGFHVAYVVVYLLLGFSYLLAMAARKLLPHPLYVLLKWIGSYGMAVLLYALVVLPVADVAALLLRATGLRYPSFMPVLGTIGLAVVIAVLLRGSRNAWSPVVRRFELVVDKPVPGREGLHIVAASDLHLGTIVGRRHLRRLVERVNALQPDLILLPGDVLDDSLEPFIRHQMADIMQELKAPLGVYAVLGNHEYFGGHIDDYVERMKKIGIEVLTDRTVLVDDRFYVAGRKDKAAERFTPEGRLPVDELLQGVDRSKPIILLDHQPHRFDLAAEAGADLMLSGHTHRGQMAPSHWITRRMFELDWGYKRKGAMHVIVSSGFGTWGPPIRIGSRSELLDIRISFAPSGTHAKTGV